MASNVPRSEEISLDGHVLFYTLGISVLTGIVFGLIPALKTLRPDTHETLKEGGRGSSGARHRTQSVFIVVEMAMAVVLLIGAGLMIRTLSALGNVIPASIRATFSHSRSLRLPIRRLRRISFARSTAKLCANSRASTASKRCP